VLTGKGQLLERRSFVVAQYFINEAIMNSRVRLNVSSVNEKAFMGNILKHYFLPFPLLNGDLKIVFPDPSVYSFDKWMLVETILKDVLMLNKVDVQKIEIIRGRSELQKQLVDLILGWMDKEIQDIDVSDFKKRVGRFIDSVPRPNVDDQSRDLDINGSISVDGDALRSLSLTNQQKKDLLLMLFALLKKHKDSQADLKDINDARHLSMLMQIVADPGTLAVDPQLREFAKNVRLELVIADDQNVNAKEREEIQGFYESMKTMSQTLTKEEKSNACFVDNSGRFEMDINCLIGRSSAQPGDDRKSVRKIVSELEEHNCSTVIKFITCIAG